MHRRVGLSGSELVEGIRGRVQWGNRAWQATRDLLNRAVRENKAFESDWEKGNMQMLAEDG